MVFKLLTLLIIWATWKLVASSWMYRHRGGYAICPVNCCKTFRDIRLPFRQDPLVDYRGLISNFVNCKQMGAAHVFGTCLL